MIVNMEDMVDYSTRHGNPACGQEILYRANSSLSNDKWMFIAGR